jgi:hypothetical protein
MVKSLIGSLIFQILKVQKISQKFVGMVGFPAISPNGFTLDEEADLEAQTLSLAQKPIESTNVQFST